MTNSPRRRENTMRDRHISAPPPMPPVARAFVHLQDVHDAAERLGKAWNRAQVEDAIRSIRFYLERMEGAME